MSYVPGRGGRSVDQLDADVRRYLGRLWRPEPKQEAMTMGSYPTDLRYSEKHEWVRAGERLVTLGVTGPAADRLGAISFVQLPYPGELFRTGDMIASITSDTATAAIQMPFVGQINAVNQALAESPGLINSDPYGEGWIARIVPGDPAAIDSLMEAGDYEAFVAANDE